MRILSCHVTGFGKFVNRAFDLSQPIIVCKQENGWGKTTLADFIECMFYGLDSGRSKSVADNLRLKYEPWSGARYGGALVFEDNGKTYRIERFFGKTPAADTVRVFDGNNMLCYDFGDKAERLGETLFGVDRASYRRTAYIPQGETQSEALTGDIKSKLLSILSATPSEGGAQKALERLDAAERALRAKRRPAKGKLDEIEEKLAYFSAQKADCMRTVNALSEERKTLAGYAEKLQKITAELKRVSQLEQEYARRGEMMANRAVRREMETTYSDANAALKELKAFFGEIDPRALNTDGLDNAVKEFYTLKEEIAAAESQLATLSAQTKEKQMLQTQLSACRKTIESFELLATASSRKEEKQKRQTREEAKFARKRRRTGRLVLMLSLAIAILGAVFSENSRGIGIAMFILGTLGTLSGFITLFRNTRGMPVRKKPKYTFDDPEIAARYEATQKEAESLLEKLSVYPPDIENKYSLLLQETEGKKARVSALDTAIGGFISNFRFEAVYDYRSALSRIKESVADYIRFTDAAQTYAQKISNLASAQTETVAELSPREVEDLVARRAALEREKERLTGEYARLRATIETQETRAAQLADYTAEEERLNEEKARLERRMLAIRTAKELLLRARSNMATRYLDPVERNCARYAEILGFVTPARLRFSGDGTPVLEENAAFRSPDYYSTGMKELLDFCVRVGLAETLFSNRRPTLVLDDPFANLDDERTIRAKTLVKKLSEKYQILYFTCKQERTL